MGTVTNGNIGEPDGSPQRISVALSGSGHRAGLFGVGALLNLVDAGKSRVLAASRDEVRVAWDAKETVWSIYDIAEPDVAYDFVAQLGLVAAPGWASGATH